MKLLTGTHWAIRGAAIAFGLLLGGGACAEVDSSAGQLRGRLEQLQNADAAAPASRERRLLDALAAFYQARAYAPIWIASARREGLLAALEGMRSDGLDPADYSVAELRRSWDPAAAAPRDDPERLGTDLLATRSCLRALSHLFRGKTDPQRLDTAWNFSPRELDREHALADLNTAIERGELAAVFERARPQHPAFGRLRLALQGLRELEARGGWPILPAGPTLKPGMRDARVTIVRQRLAASGYLPSADGGDLYDEALSEAVRQFQTEQYLAVDGAVGKETRAALAVGIADRIAQVRVNLERARWLLHELHDDLVVVDIAGFKVSYYRGAAPIWSARVQIGRTYRKTPSFKAEITHVTFNPTWTVPPTILRHDVLPKVRRNPGYLAANHLRAIDADGHEVPPDRIDWQHAAGITLRQDAGQGNSLGRVAIRFPNRYDVYMHDTPHTELFDRAQRTFSSGCIRVERPRELVELLFDDPEHWNRAAIDQAIDEGSTRNVTLPHPVTLLIAYWSVDTHDGGRVSFKSDIYGRDARVLAALDTPAGAVGRAQSGATR